MSGKLQLWILRNSWVRKLFLAWSSQVRKTFWVDEAPGARRVLAEHSNKTKLLKSPGSKERSCELIQGVKQMSSRVGDKRSTTQGENLEHSDTVSEHVHMMAVQLL